MLKYLPVITFLSGLITSAAISYAIANYVAENEYKEHMKEHHSDMRTYRLDK